MAELANVLANTRKNANVVCSGGRTGGADEDNVDRLISATRPATSYSYTYDAVGNRLTRTAGSSTDTYAYSTTSNRLPTLPRPSGLSRVSFRFFARDAV